MILAYYLRCILILIWCKCMFLSVYNRGICILLLAISQSAIANNTGNQSLQFSGFSTIGAVYSDSEDYGYRNNISSDEGAFKGGIDFKQHSLLGLQTNWSISSEFDFVSQAVLRDLPEPSLNRYITLAFLRYELNTHWSFRLGRTATDLFLLTEYRDIGFSYAWATAPNEVYGLIPYRSLDGIDITYSQRALGGVLKGKVFTGISEADISTADIVEQVKAKDIVGVSLSFDHFNWLVNAKYSQSKIASEATSSELLSTSISQIPDFLWPNSDAFAQSILLDGERVKYYSLSGQYQWKQWLASLEVSRITSKSRVIPKINSAYVALSYQFDAHQFYGIYAFVNSRQYVFDEAGVNEELLPELVDASTQVMNSYAPNQNTISLGWRWNITNYMASSLQWNYTQIDSSGDSLWLNTASSQDNAENINTILLNLSMAF